MPEIYAYTTLSCDSCLMSHMIWPILYVQTVKLIWSKNESYKDAISFKQNRAHNEMKQNLKKFFIQGKIQNIDGDSS